MFPSRTSGLSVTKTSKLGECYREGKRVVVIDTPGLFNTILSQEEVVEEIRRGIELASSKLDACLYIFRIGRHTDEEVSAMKEILAMVGNTFFQRTILVFTGIDYLEDETIQQYVKGIPQFHNIIQQCSGHYLSINNRSSENDKEDTLKELFNLINKIKYSAFSGKEFYKRKNITRLMKLSVFGVICWGVNELFWRGVNHINDLSMNFLDSYLFSWLLCHAAQVDCFTTGYPNSPF